MGVNVPAQEEKMQVQEEQACEQREGEGVKCGHVHVWSESEDCLPFLQLAQDYISSCGKKTLHEILEKVFKSFRPLLGLPDVDDDAFEEYNADVEEEEPEADHQQMGVSQQ
nr:maturin [Dromaius novaehollandiae]